MRFQFSLPPLWTCSFSEKAGNQVTELHWEIKPLHIQHPGRQKSLTNRSGESETPPSPPPMSSSSSKEWMISTTNTQFLAEMFILERLGFKSLCFGSKRDPREQRNHFPMGICSGMFPKSVSCHLNEFAGVYHRTCPHLSGASENKL